MVTASRSSPRRTGKYFGGLDINAFANYLKANSPYTPAPLTRITKLG